MSRSGRVILYFLAGVCRTLPECNVVLNTGAADLPERTAALQRWTSDLWEILSGSSLPQRIAFRASVRPEALDKAWVSALAK